MPNNSTQFKRKKKRKPLLDARVALGVSLAAIGEELDVNPSTVYGWEQGRGEVSAEMLAKWKGYLGAQLTAAIVRIDKAAKKLGQMKP